MKGLVGLSECKLIIYSSIVRVEKVVPPGFEPASYRSRNRHVNHRVSNPRIARWTWTWEGCEFISISVSIKCVIASISFSKTIEERYYCKHASCNDTMPWIKLTVIVSTKRSIANNIAEYRGLFVFRKLSNLFDSLVVLSHALTLALHGNRFYTRVCPVLLPMMLCSIIEKHFNKSISE